MNVQRLLKISALLFVVGWYAFFLARKIDFTAVDLGRHLKNGEMVLLGNAGNILKTNFYSYTYPDFPTVNHHWGAGVLFFLSWKLAGFEGVSFLYTLLQIIVFLIFFNIARREGGWRASLLGSLLVIPLLAERREVRPEVMSYLFLAIFFLLLWMSTKHGLHRKWLLLLPFVEILWVNSHIYFLLGPFLVGIFLVEELFQKSRKNAYSLAGIFIMVLIATFVNPWGMKGVMYPFQIFDNYGLRLIENQSVWFLWDRLHRPNLIRFPLIFSMVAAGFLIVWRKDRERFSFVLAILCAVFGLMAWFAIRNFGLFGMVALPALAINIHWILNHRDWGRSGWLNFCLGGVMIGSLAADWHSFSPWRSRYPFGFGLVPGVQGAAEFMKKEDIRGPVFNNYDAGSYLIYNLFPKERVFLDNRPEAYPSSFLQETYVDMQKNEDTWRSEQNRYGFNSIVFNYHDRSSWGQDFLAKRIEDSEWAPVFADANIVIFLKRNSQNQRVLRQYEIPKSQFMVVQF